jgi:hypothetical protein
MAAVQQVIVGRASTLRRKAAVHSNVQAMRFGIIRKVAMDYFCVRTSGTATSGRSQHCGLPCN